MQFKKTLCILLIFSFPFFNACKTSKVEQQKKKIGKTKELKETETIKRYNKALKHHQAIQSSETRKRMKSNLSNSYNTPRTKKKFFLVRWFSKNKDTPCPASTK